jgi:hypothetical protein
MEIGFRRYWAHGAEAKKIPCEAGRWHVVRWRLNNSPSCAELVHGCPVGVNKKIEKWFWHRGFRGPARSRDTEPQSMANTLSSCHSFGQRIHVGVRTAFFSASWPGEVPATHVEIARQRSAALRVAAVGLSRAIQRAPNMKPCSSSHPRVQSLLHRAAIALQDIVLHDDVGGRDFRPAMTVVEIGADPHTIASAQPDSRGTSPAMTLK